MGLRARAQCNGQHPPDQGNHEGTRIVAERSPRSILQSFARKSITPARHKACNDPATGWRLDRWGCVSVRGCFNVRTPLQSGITQLDLRRTRAHGLRGGRRAVRSARNAYEQYVNSLT